MPAPPEGRAITHSEQRADTGGPIPWDRFIRGAAVGAAAVLIVFLGIASVVYFGTDYEFSPTFGDDGAVPTLPPPTLNGQAIAASTGCTACHSVDGSMLVGPTWLGLAGTERPLADGTTVLADAAYLRESILDPLAKIADGFAENAIMPQIYGSVLDDAQVDAIVAYIQSLGG